MVSTSALIVGDDVQRVFDDIERQFQLDTPALVALTNAFLDEIARGLADYGQPMAMMCVLSSSFPPDFLQIFTTCRPTFVSGVPDGSEKG